MDEKHKVFLNVYLILEKDGRVLLSQRQNTGYEDGKWSLVSGHWEKGETATQALIREAKEEIGITIGNEDLKVVYVLHRHSNRDNIDLFMKCNRWVGDISNQEPYKCGGLEFFSYENLPSNLIECIREVLYNLRNGKVYSEYGWENAC